MSALESFTSDLFAPHLDTTFRIRVDTATAIEARLIEVKERARHARADRTPFTLLFRGPADAALPQRIYAMEHAALGAFELFLVTVGPDAHGMRYEAVFT
ncbi:MAG TPA: hypothetical protein VF188_06830 [Longimicrobiales bacterium]